MTITPIDQKKLPDAPVFCNNLAGYTFNCQLSRHF